MSVTRGAPGIRRPLGLRWMAAAALILLATATLGQMIDPPEAEARSGAAAGGGTGGGTGTGALPGARHVFVINLENKGYDSAWGPASAAPYLAGTLRNQGVLLTQYFGVAHNSLPNYIAQISGQGPNPQTQADCQTYSPFVGAGTTSPGQYVGNGCVYPAAVPTVAGQLTDSGRTWKGYMEDMGSSCRHPSLGAVDDTQKARVGDQYAVRHNPFVYFASITGSPDCARNDVDLNALTADLASTATTPNLSMITPNLCHDGHDAPCVDGQPGGLASADEWLKRWVPAITSSPAFKRDGVLVITFDESDSPQTDSSACCGEGPGPNSPLPGITGLGGGRVGALVLSPFVAAGTTSTTPYNHYSLLASIEDTFALPYLGYAATPGLNRFGLDVYNGGRHR
ncbi:phosphoesterase [Cryobacterium sp. TMT1-21]|uniref:Phosphoesterase n=1 Tax=Cryobacterium shii TaxID=1259235 RepID=A0AAQ2C767_9MICO|nr:MULTISPECIES: alkaline phosphatase family protein [Cryobacterium]TFC49266.1 phosphoesterase [Cryobacterium shii]TFC83491.1 phosphoesterase [Cryobacterium sp. TmT2-59]TFD16184.1 phosphoesterase [Cryobacterium sp. TMT4-10]TFD18288.1 phosphoesterase [Cryobacterium sp. TMT1-21]TFD37283.1 phosphoesterase [Cryobacterium sp. TMT2-10]